LIECYEECEKFVQRSNNNGASINAPTGHPAHPTKPSRKRTVRNTQSLKHFGDLPLGGTRRHRRARPSASNFHPTISRLRKPARATGNDLGVAHQLDEQLALPVGILLTALISGEFAGFVGRENSSKRKIADRRRVKNRVHFLDDTAFSFSRRSAAVVKVSTRCARRSPDACHGADERITLVTARREKIGQLRAEAAGREIS